MASMNQADSWTSTNGMTSTPTASVPALAERPLWMSTPPAGASPTQATRPAVSLPGPPATAPNLVASTPATSMGMPRATLPQTHTPTASMMQSKDQRITKFTHAQSRFETLSWGMVPEMMSRVVCFILFVRPVQLSKTNKHLYLQEVSPYRHFTLVSMTGLSNIGFVMTASPLLGALLWHFLRARGLVQQRVTSLLFFLLSPASWDSTSQLPHICHSTSFSVLVFSLTVLSLLVVHVRV